MIETHRATVRSAANVDGPEIARLIERAMAEYREADALMQKGYVAYSLDPAHAIGADQLVADVDGRIVGSVLFFPRVLHRPSWPATVSTFGTLAVDPDARRQGIGNRLVAACVERARESGATGVVIETMPFMRSGEAFYGRVGFARWEAGDWNGTSVLRTFLGGGEAPRTVLSAWRLDFG